ncbi:MAG: deoxyguanosinetriphosphate triphosphohydrolase [Eubacteriales bacterium]|nr:deoxyguanosinetriphosphate triphosphohydrolase [Eubacteriales bacterium]
MFFREKYEKREYDILSGFATKAAASKGRERYLEPCPMRTVFQRDRDRIIHCKSFRRLKHKTQVFLSPEGDHYRTRLTHTLEVSQIARTISRCLLLNEDLTEAIALGHDLGHTPFGHSGERVLNELAGHFEHNEQSLRVVELLEGGEGLNLTYEVRDGILNHKKNLTPSTPEGMVVNHADRIAYINHDIDDALRAGIIDKIPEDCARVLGETHSGRINTMIRDIVGNSSGRQITMSAGIDEMTEKLRQFMFEHVYLGSKAKEQESKAEMMIRMLFRHYMNAPGDMGPDAGKSIERFGLEQTVTDYIAGMTDRFAVNVFMDIYIPKGWNKF